MHIQEMGFIIHGTERSVPSFFDQLHAQYPFKAVERPFVHQKRGADGPEWMVFVLLAFHSPGPTASALEQCVDEIGEYLVSHQMLTSEDLLQERKHYLEETAGPERAQLYEAACNPEPLLEALCC